MDTAVLDQRSQQSVISAITRRERCDPHHPSAIDFVCLVELLDESEGQSAS
jgi:hypothetical protein